MAKVHCEELKSQKCNFAFVGDKQFDEHGIVEIDHPELLEQLRKVRGYKILDEPKIEVKLEPEVEKPAASKKRKAEEAKPAEPVESKAQTE